MMFYFSTTMNAFLVLLAVAYAYFVPYDTASHLLSPLPDVTQDVTCVGHVFGDLDNRGLDKFGVMLRTSMNMPKYQRGQFYIEYFNLPQPVTAKDLIEATLSKVRRETTSRVEASVEVVTYGKGKFVSSYYSDAHVFRLTDSQIEALVEKMGSGHEYWSELSARFHDVKDMYTDHMHHALHKCKREHHGSVVTRGTKFNMLWAPTVGYHVENSSFAFGLKCFCLQMFIVMMLLAGANVTDEKKKKLH